MIFVDTSAWFAASVPTDKYYSSADAFLASVDSQLLLTTDYVVSETLTLFRVRGENSRASIFGRQVFEQRICRIEWVQQEDIHKAWIEFEASRHQQWSFVDCVSKVVINRLGITTAFSFDRHFRSFGTVSVVP